MDEFQVNTLQRKFPTIDEVRKVVKMPPGMIFVNGIYRSDCYEAVTRGCWSIVMALTTRAMPGSFIHAVLMNDLMEAFMRADEINTLCMWSYCCFLYNEVPGGMRQDYAAQFTRSKEG